MFSKSPFKSSYLVAISLALLNSPGLEAAENRSEFPPILKAEGDDVETNNSWLSPSGLGQKIGADSDTDTRLLLARNGGGAGGGGGGDGGRGGFGREDYDGSSTSFRGEANRSRQSPNPDSRDNERTTPAPDGDPGSPPWGITLTVRPKILKQVADPEGATAGVAGAAAEAVGKSEADWVNPVRNSDLPQHVKRRLLSPEHHAFVERCSGPALELQRARALLSKQGFTDLTAAVDSFSSSEAQEFVEDVITPYERNCLSSASKLSNRKIKRFIRKRVGVLRSNSGTVFCTATLIAPTAILTAHHCLFDRLGRLIGADKIKFYVDNKKYSISNEVHLSYYYKTKGIYYDPRQPHYDSVLLYLKQAIPDDRELPFHSIGVRVAEKHDDLVLISFNAYRYLSRSWQEKLNGDGVADWSLGMAVDPTASCIVAHSITPTVFLHPCQTEGSSSGAPLISYSPDDDRIWILGIHTGGFVLGPRDEKIWRDAQVDTRLVPNYANSIEHRVAYKLTTLSGGAD